MASLARGDVRRSHSWLWDSHISPKNSRWLHENLNDMDAKVKSMFKIVNEEADSFARKAEMYYKRRPELVKLVEDFYRAYRALAERYVHATRALKQAQRTMVEAFPEVPTPTTDDSPVGSVMGDEPRISDGTPRSDSSFDAFTPNKDGVKKNGLVMGNVEFLNARKGLKTSETFSQGLVSSWLLGSGARKELDFDEEFDDVFEKAQNLQEMVTKLTSENENLMEQVKLEAQNSSDAQNEIQILKDAQSKLISEKEEAILKFQECLEKVINLEAELERFKNINDELQKKADRHEDAMEICRLLKEENLTLQSKVIMLEQKSTEQQEELTKKEEEFKKLKISVHDERMRSEQVEAALGSLEKLHSEAQEKLKSSSLEIQNGIEMLKDMELRKQALEGDIRRVQEENDNLNREVKQKEGELEALTASLQNEITRSVQAEATLQSLERLHAQTQEELQQLMLDMQNKVHNLKDVESQKESIEEELVKLKEEIRILNEQNVSSQMMITLLQDEILSLKDANKKLETEVTLHVDGKEKLQNELNGLKGELDILHQKHQETRDQMHALGFDELSFQTSVKELQDGNAALKETCKKHEDENAILQEKLKKMEKISENNANLEVSLLDANVEIDELREKINALQVSYEALNQKHLVLVSEKNSLVLKVGSITENMGKLLESNTFLENSVSDTNYELEELRGKMKTLEDSSRLLHDDNSNLQGEKNMVLSQMDLIGKSLERLEKKYVELHDKHSNLEREKESTQRVLTELSEMSRAEKREHEDFRHSTNARLAVLENQIHILHQDGAKREEKFKEEQFKLLAAQIETFILQQSLCDLKHGNMSLAREHHRLEKHILGQEGNMVLLLELIGRLRKGMHKVLNALVNKEEFEFSDAMEESCWHFILNKVKEIQNTIAVNEDEKLLLQIENSVTSAIAQQLQSELAELKSEKNAVELDYHNRTEELVFLQTEKCNLLGINEQLKQDLQEGSQKQEALEKEIQILGLQLSELKKAHSITHDERFKLVQECQLLSSEISDLKGEKTSLEEVNGTLLQEFVSADGLSLIFEQFSLERADELKRIMEELKGSQESNKDLEKKVDEMNEKIQVIEEENFKLKDYVLKSEECKSHLTVSYVEGSIFKDVNEELNHRIGLLNKQIESGDSLLVLKDKELTEAHAVILELKDREKKMLYNLENTMAEVEAAKIARDGLEKQIFSLSSEMINRDQDITLANAVNEALNEEILKLNEENEALKVKEEQLSSNLKREIDLSENEVAVLCSDIQEGTVHAVVLEDKVHELIGVCEKLEVENMVERTTLSEEVTRKNAHIKDLSGKVSGLEGSKSKLKSELDEYLPIISSLRDGIAALESYIIPSGSSNPKDQLNMKAGPRMPSPELYDPEKQFDAAIPPIPVGLLELQKLLAKVAAIQGVLAQSGGQLALHSIDSDVKGNEGGVVALKISDLESSFPVMQAVQDGEDPEKNLMSELKMSGEEEDLVTKDIPLDQVSSSSKFDADDGLYTMDINDDNHDLDNPSPPIIHRGDMDSIFTETIEGKSECPPSDLIERELSIDKVEVTLKENDLQRDWRKEAIEKLQFDSRRLVILEKNVEELKGRIEKSEESSGQKSMDFDFIKTKLNEANNDISRLIDLNKQLTQRAEDCPSTSEGQNAEFEEAGNLQRKVSRRAIRWSEKIGRLESDVQKIHYILLKLEEEREIRSNKSSARRKVVLRDYLYGRGGDGNRKKSVFSWCTRPKTEA